MVISPKARPHLLDIIQVSARIIHVCFKKQGGNLRIIGAYGPDSGLDLEEDRQPFWDHLEDHISKIPQPEPVYLTGDFNVRFQARRKNDEGVTRPFTYGKGSRYIDRNCSSNRSLCVKTVQRLDMVEAASYRTPDPTHHITYRDKAAPPKDWSQFLLDPLIIQQFYDLLHHQMGTEALAVAAKVRSFLEMDSLLPPPKVSISLLQRPKSNLQQRPHANPDPRGLISSVTLPARKLLTKVRDLWEDGLGAPDHNSFRQSNGIRRTVFTDGSGSRGLAVRIRRQGGDGATRKAKHGLTLLGPLSRIQITSFIGGLRSVLTTQVSSPLS